MVTVKVALDYANAELFIEAGELSGQCLLPSMTDRNTLPQRLKLFTIATVKAVTD